MVTLLPASGAGDEGGTSKRRIHIALDAPQSSKKAKVKVKASFRFPSKKAEDKDEDDDK